MRWLAFSSLVLFALAALAPFAVNLLVDRAEARRIRRHPARPRNVFRPVLIEGGRTEPVETAPRKDADRPSQAGEEDRQASPVAYPPKSLPITRAV